MEKSHVTIPIRMHNCRHKVDYIEHIEVYSTILMKPRGNLAISLRSPRGTVSRLLEPRPKDREKDRFFRWRFTSVHFWGESTEGKWLLTLKNSGTLKTLEKGRATIHQLIIHGFRRDDWAESNGLI